MIGNKLKELRIKKGYTMQKVAEDLGISISAYQKYEYSARDVSTDMLNTLANYFKVTTDYLLGRSDEKPDAVEMLTSEEFEQELLREYFSLPDNVRAEIRKMMKQAVERSERRKRGILISGSSEKAIARGGRGFLDLPTPEQEAAAEDITDNDDF